MCETNAYVKSGDKEEIYMESLARIEVDGGMLTLVGVLGDRMQLNGKIVEANFQAGKVILQRL